MNFEKEGRELTQKEFEKLTGAKWVPTLEFLSPKVALDIQKRGEKLLKKGAMTREQIWFGSYFQKEILAATSPNVVIRWINPTLGWGVFTLKPLKKMEFVAEYVGKVRKRKWRDSKNAYCFEYVLAQGHRTPYTIDAMEQGGVSRYINHGTNPNLLSALATFQNVSHVILYAKEAIPINRQLCYDYGPDYWSKRTPPISL